MAQVCLLEAWLTQGAYNRVLDAKDAMAGSPEAALFLSKLAETVRWGWRWCIALGKGVVVSWPSSSASGD